MAAVRVTTAYLPVTVSASDELETVRSLAGTGDPAALETLGSVHCEDCFTASRDAAERSGADARAGVRLAALAVLVGFERCARHREHPSPVE